MGCIRNGNVSECVNTSINSGCYTRSMLTVSLLGTPTLSLDSQPLALSRRKSRAILYYVAAHRNPLTREQLLAFLWPDLDRPAAQQTLRTTLHGLRKALGSHLLVDENILKLAPGTDIDVRRFEAGLQSPLADLQSLGSHLALYRGDFLEGFTLPDTSAFDDWAIIEREYYRHLAVRGFTTLSQLHEAYGNFGAALEAIDRALAFDALQEDLQQAAMRLHYLSGDRAGAIRRYDSLRKLLDEEMGVPPMAETRSVYDSIINDTLQPLHPEQSPRAAQHLPSLNPRPPSRNPLVAAEARRGDVIYQLPFSGRSAELQTLRDLITSHKLALLEGEPGIGKTRLAEEFINAVPSGALALVGGAHELEQSLPYQPVIEALRGLLTRDDWPAVQAAVRAMLTPVWLAEVAHLLPEIDAMAASRATSMPADESRLWEGLHQFLVTLAVQRPLIFFIDDLQWADTSTVALLGYLARQGSAPIFYLAATRPIPPRSPLASLLQTLTREGRLFRLNVSPLDAAHIMTIVQHLSVQSQHREVLGDWLIRSSEGNPYILAELIRHARNSGLITPDGPVSLSAFSGSPIVPQSIYTLIQARLDRLSEAARRVLDAAVVLGREFEFEVVYRAAGLSESAALDALDELLAAALVRPRDHAAEAAASQLLYVFHHRLTLEVAYREVGEARHRLLHRRVAEAIETVYSPRRLESVAGLIASHFVEGNAPDRAAPYAFRAGQQAVRLAAWKEATKFFEQALAIDTDDPQRYAINMELGEARFQGGALAPATEAFRAALVAAAPGTLEADQAHLALARSLITQARFAEAIDHLRQVSDSTPALAVQRDFTWGAALSVEGADLAAASEHLRGAESRLAQSSSPGDLPLLAQIKFELGSVAAQQGELQKAVMLYGESLEIAEEAPGDTGVTQRILAHNNLGYHLHLLRDSKAHDHAWRGLQLAENKGVLRMKPYLLSTLGEIALAADDLDLAERYFTEGLALAEQISMPERLAGLTANLGLVAQARGQKDLAIHRLSTALARADALGTRHLAAQIRLWLAPLLPSAQAHTYLAEVRAFAQSSGRQRLLEAVRQLEKD